MKFSESVPSFLFLLPGLASAAKCGKWYSADCVCDTDIRYCKEGQNGASDDILDQHPLWKHMQGFYKFTATRFDFGLYTGLNVNAVDNPYIGYLNHTIVGSRDFQHRYDIFPPVDPSDDTKCVNSTDPFLNNLVGWECGVNGVLYLFEGFAVSTPERDGSLTTTPQLVALGDGGDAEDPYIKADDDPDYKMVPIDEKTLQGSVDAKTLMVTETFVFTDAENKVAGSVQDVYIKVGDGSVLVQSTRFKFTKIDEKTFTDGLTADLKKYNIPDVLMPDAVPMTRTCLNEKCPTEEDFCKLDPKCIETKKYLEPDAATKAGPIVGIVSAVFAVLLLVLYFGHRHKLAQQKDRLKNMFAKRIVQSLKIGDGASDVYFTMEGLQKEFNRIDVGAEGGDGMISKEELRAFMTSGKIGEVSDSDFETLFGIIDADGSGEVDFVEFAAFMGQIKGDIQSFKEEEENA